ncbi:hypothetical protein AOQ84DRAFT_351191 [Glonium stellatum]|uniref:Uncharacterized protein n=1 Tax=Glonium stellatum TaxID=574774 RepID=A0A8E2FEJ1_9PEZI|nr:hypothetical protein AOQ84DRAFT_351191 [Glonium stellatum]
MKLLAILVYALATTVLASPKTSKPKGTNGHHTSAASVRGPNSVWQLSLLVVGQQFLAQFL